jgi:hypothetical protein
MKTKILFLIISLFSISLLIAGENGGYAGSFLRMGVGARSNALGNAGVADRPNGYSFYYNPSATAFLENKIVSLSYSFLSLDRKFNFIGFSMKVPPSAGFSLALINTGVDNLIAYNSLGEVSGDLNQSANGAFFNFAKKFGEKISIGLSIKYVWESISAEGEDYNYSSNGVGWDFGLTYLFNNDLTLAAMVRDVGTKFKANTSDLREYGGTTIDQFPNLYNVGFRYVTPVRWLRVLYDFEWSEKEAYKNHVGIEAVYLPGTESASAENLAVRLGVNGQDFVAGAGMGFELFGYKSYLDYAFVPSIIDEGSSHIFSWQFYLK